jgi:oligoendopeptidase F
MERCTHESPNPFHWFNKWLREKGFPHITFHQLRHTHITLLIANGTDIAIVSKRAGHTKQGTTLNNYNHALKSRDAIAANKLDDMFTLAHEMGHAMHSYYSWAAQPNVYGDYTIFLAEVASTVNEVLLMEYMLSETKEPAMRAYLLNDFLEQFRGTIFRQVMFAEFEMITHEMAEKNEPLTLESLNAVYRDLLSKYYGPDMVLDEKIDLEWGRIPHFYRAFYVYQYATGYSAAIAFSQKLLQKGEKGKEAVDAYLRFLQSGASDYSINILQKAGVDMSSPAPVREALGVFEKLLTQMEGLVYDK